MSPASAYMQRYLDDVTWDYRGVTYSVRIEKYLNTKTPDRFENAKNAWSVIGGVLDEFVVGVHDHACPKFKSHFQIDGAPWTFEDNEIRNTFHGKASPLSISKTLWLAMHCGLIRGPSPMPGPTWSTVAPRSPQQFADDCLGTDCSGFVNCFHGRKTGHLEIKKYDTTVGRKDLEDVFQGDVLVAESHGHIAIIEGVKKVTFVPANLAKIMIRQKVNPLPKELWEIRVVESLGYKGKGVTNSYVRMARMESPSEHKYCQVRTDLDKPAHYYFLPAMKAGAPVP
jgi:hypothetical protein